MVLAVAVPLFIEELREASRDLPAQLEALQKQFEPWVTARFKTKLPHTFADWMKWARELIERMQGQPSGGGLSVLSSAIFGTLGYVAALVSALIIPVFALYLLIDFDSIVARAGTLVPRRWSQPVGETFAEIHTMLGGYLRGQLTANLVLATLYASGLRWVDIRLAVPIGVLTGMLAFVPYVGFGLGLVLAMAMALLDIQHAGRVLGVLGVMLGVQLLDGMVITPRIVGRSVGLSALEVLLALSVAGTLFGFVGVLFAVPLGAITKIIVRRLIASYLGSGFYNRASSEN
jgi:phosphoribosylaminoimidazole-succinocarboxamide synthase